MKVRLALAQINPTVGDLPGNAKLASKAIAEAKRQGCNIVAFPELALCGYPPEDLLLKRQFLEDCDRILRVLAREASGIAVLIGAPSASRDPRGRSSNACYILHEKKIAAVYRKINLPNYGVFDEKRYFEPGRSPMVVCFGESRVGVNICEDAWVEDGPTTAQVSLGGAGIVVNISASPYHRGKSIERESLMQRRARENSCWFCSVNLVGGQDELVFDGCSVVASPDGRTVARGKAFEEDMLIVDIEAPEREAFVESPVAKLCKNSDIEIVELSPISKKRTVRAIRPTLAPHLEPMEEIYRGLVLGTRDYIEKNRFPGVVLGVSGGIDSALVAAIAVDAIGARRVVGVTMPSPYTSRETLRDARAVCRNLGIRTLEIPITDLYESYLRTLDPAFQKRKPDVTEENIQARIRGNILMALSNKFGWLVLTTGNKSELAVGYCTLYGDMAGGFAVIKDVPKTLVYSLCRYRNRLSGRRIIPLSVLMRKPSAELKPAQCDQDTLPPYDILDRIIELYVEQDLSFEEIVEEGIDPAVAKRVISMIEGSEYKRRQGAPGIKITPKAFGRDRRLPITNRYRSSARRIKLPTSRTERCKDKHPNRTLRASKSR